MVITNKVASAYMILFYLSPLQINPAVKSNNKKKNHGLLNLLQCKENEGTFPHSITTICRRNHDEITIYQIPPCVRDLAASIH